MPQFPARTRVRGPNIIRCTEVKNAVHDLEQAELVITAAQESRDLAAKNLAAEERKYQLGAETIFFVLDAQNQLSQAEQSRVQAQIAYQKALAEVDHATGSLLAKHKLVSVSPIYLSGRPSPFSFFSFRLTIRDRSSLPSVNSTSTSTWCRIAYSRFFFDILINTYPFTHEVLSLRHSRSRPFCCCPSTRGT